MTTSSSLQKPTFLRSDSLTEPMGLGEPRPLLSWVLRSDARDQRQSAYHIQMADSVAALESGESLLWDSGRIESNATTHVVCGCELISRQCAVWRVRAWDAGGVATAWSEPARIEMGLLAPNDWTAEWIRAEHVGTRWHGALVPFFRKGFELGKAVRRARLYSTALGLVEVWINGQRVGDEAFTPGWTDYRTRVQSRTHDVTALLKSGANAIGAVLGDGWFCGHVGARGRQLYGDRPQLMLQLECELEDGSIVRVVTDGSWKTSTGPVLESDLLMGEVHDARRDLGAWHSPGYHDAEWRPVLPGAPVALQVDAFAGPLVRRQQELKPIGTANPIHRWMNGSVVFDFGQNFTGRVRFRIRHRKGATVRMRFAEILNAEGRPYYDNLRSARATDSYTFASDEEETFEPRFTFHGFRYVELISEGNPLAIGPDAVTGVVIHSDLPETGAFECSHDLVNQLQKNIVWSQRGNFLDIPTDCPQRDERLGWTGDAQIFVRTACFNRDVEPFFVRWQKDLADAQYEAGGIPPFAPNSEFDVTAKAPDSGPAWSDAVVICPWTIWLCYGNRRILERHFQSMVRFVDYLKGESIGLIRSHPDYQNFGGFGDWLSNGASTRRDLIGTAFFAYSTELVARAAEVIGERAEAERLRTLHGEIVAAFQRRFVTPDGLLVDGSQTAHVLALQFGLLTESAQKQAVQALVRDIKDRGNHLSTGFVGTPYLMRVLSDRGHLDVAYALLEQTTPPSWLFPVTAGATTIWERWDGWTRDKGFQDAGMNSFNHYAYGAIGEWLYSTVAGLELDASEPGFRHIRFRPHPGGSLTHATARLQTPHGEAAIAWKLVDGTLHLDLDVPVNCRATLRLPPGWDKALMDRDSGEGLPLDGTKRALGSGHYAWAAGRK